MLPRRALRATEKGRGEEDSAAALSVWCPAPPTSAHKDAQDVGVPQCSSGQGAIKHQEVLSPSVHNQLQSRNGGERRARAASPPLHHQTRSPRCYRNAFPRGSNARVSLTRSEKLIQPHVCQAGEAAAAPSHCLCRRRLLHMAPLAGTGLPNSVQTLSQAALTLAWHHQQPGPLFTAGLRELGEGSLPAAGSQPAGS